VRVDIDKTRQDRKAAPVDFDRVAVFGRPGRADRGDRVAVDRQIDITAIAMGLRRLVPGDEPGGVANDLPRRGSRGSGMVSHRSRERRSAQITASRQVRALNFDWPAGSGLIKT